MGLSWLLALQAAATPAPPPPMARIDFDLAKVEPSPLRCEEGADDAIVVCGRVRGPMNRFTPEEMEELARLYAEKPVRAGIGLGGGSGAGLDFSPTPMPGGVVSNRMMVTVKIPF